MGGGDATCRAVVVVAGTLLVANNWPALWVAEPWVPIAWVPVAWVPVAWVPATWFCLGCTRTVVAGPAAKTGREVRADLADEWVNLLAEMSLRVAERLL